MNVPGPFTSAPYLRVRLAQAGAQEDFPGGFDPKGEVPVEEGTTDERQVRAGRNQSMFRAANERLKDLNDAFGGLNGTYAIACECADTSCLATIEIRPEEYEGVREASNRFAVLPGHVYPDVELVVAESDGYVVVEKVAAAAEVAAVNDPRRG